MKKLTLTRKSHDSKLSKQRIVYTAPAVIYEGQITARAGTIIDKPDGGAADPTDLFGTN